MNLFQQAMGNLDAALTEKDFNEATRQFHHMPKTVEEWIERPGGNPLWYLSDCGYSRVVFSMERGYLFLTDNSSSQVKARWEACKPQRDAVENVMKAELKNIYPGIASAWEKPMSEALDIVSKLLHD
jgi:hypothetical protein